MNRPPKRDRPAGLKRAGVHGGRAAGPSRSDGLRRSGPGSVAGQDGATGRTGAARHGVARVLSKAGLCSRSEAARWVQDRRVSVDGRIVTDPEHPVIQGRSQVRVDGQPLERPQHRYVMLNKPRGLVTTTQDEKGRDTVYRCLEGGGLPWVAPVGRLDKASEGLLLFSSDPQWAAAITTHEGGVTKTYHVQVDAIVDEGQLAALSAGVEHEGELLRAVSVRRLRQGDKTCWLEVVLDEGRNRHIRRLMDVHGLAVLRLVRVAIGTVRLGDLAKGQWRDLDAQEVQSLAPASCSR